MQDYEIEYMEKIGSSSPVSIWCYKRIYQTFPVSFIHTGMFHMLCYISHQKQSNIVYSPLCLEATVCEEAIFVPEARLRIWQLNQEYVCTWIWAQLPLHRVWCTLLLIYITTFLYVCVITLQYFLYCMLIMRSYRAIFRAWLLYLDYYKP